MKKCPYCAEQIQDDAIKCRYCGEFIDGRPRQMGPLGGPPMGVPGYYWGYEYRSQAELFGLPLVHIAQGYDPQTGRPRVAKGIIAIGNIAIGVFAMGGLALGGIVFGGVGLGLVAIGGVAVGLAALGGLAMGGFIAMGGAAISLMFAVGGLALAPHSIGPMGIDPQLLQMLERWFPGIDQVFPK